MKGRFQPRRRWMADALALVVVSALAGCIAPSGEPRNLTSLKREIRSYVDSGRYEEDLAKVAARAKAWIEERAGRGGAMLTVVFDLDETLLQNWPQIRDRDYGYVPEEWDRWVAKAAAPAIAPVREVYRAARARNVDVVFLTGRGEDDRDATVKNLRAIECADFALLICKPDGKGGTAAEYKTAERRKLTESGRTIIANIGDQESDLVGGYSERVFKLPNAFYLID